MVQDIKPGYLSFCLGETTYAGRSTNQCIGAGICGSDSSVGLLTLKKDGQIKIRSLGGKMITNVYERILLIALECKKTEPVEARKACHII